MARTAVTGTPGSGKSTLAQLLQKRGETVVDLKAWAAEAGAIAGHDELDGSDVIDLDILATRLDELPPDCFIDSHLAHLLPVDGIWVLRCDPRLLRTRMTVRGYSDRKILENLEAEAIDLILQEAAEAADDGTHVIARDGSRRTPEELLSAFVEAQGGTGKNPDIEPVDWSDQLPFR